MGAEQINATAASQRWAPRARMAKNAMLVVATIPSIARSRQLTHEGWTRSATQTMPLSEISEVTNRTPHRLRIPAKDFASQARVPAKKAGRARLQAELIVFRRSLAALVRHLGIPGRKARACGLRSVSAEQLGLGGGRADAPD